MEWTDRVREDNTLRRITYSNGDTEDVHITEVPGNVLTNGTPINKTNMQNLDDRAEANKYNIGIKQNYDDFSTTSTYDIGDYVLYQNVLYICIEEITTPGIWDNTKWEQVNLITMINELKQLINTQYTTLNTLIINNKNSADASISAINTTLTSLEEVELYDNTNGTSSTITLNMSSSEFRYIDIFFGYSTTTGNDSVRVYSPNGKRVALTLNLPGPPIIVYNGTVKIQDDTITFEDGGGLSLVATEIYGNVENNGIVEGNEMKIFRVVGHY